MTSEISDLISKLVHAYAKQMAKQKNYTDTFSREFLLDCLKMTEGWMMMQHCIEDRKAMDRRNEWIDKNTDDLAEKEQELKDTKVKDIPWNRIIMNSRVSKRLKNE